MAVKRRKVGNGRPKRPKRGAVATQRLIGNYGAALVMTRLSAQALVRPVAVDTDVGVDLYCETVSQGVPFLHFWVQVKTGSQCRVGKRGAGKGLCSVSIQKADFEYWERQPVPVFLALVPTPWPPDTEPPIYIVDFTTEIVRRKQRGKVPSVLRASQRWQPGDDAAVQRFLTETVPDACARLGLRAGVVGARPTVAPEYVRRTPTTRVALFAWEISEQIRKTAAMGVLYSIMDTGQSARPPLVEFRRRMAGIVELFGDEGPWEHWENYYARGLSRHLDGEFADAIALYERAKRSIEGDVAFSALPGAKQQLDLIDQVIQIARDKAVLGVRLVEVPTDG